MTVCVNLDWSGLAGGHSLTKGYGRPGFMDGPRACTVVRTGIT